MNIEQEIKDILQIPGVVEATLWGSRYILPEHDHKYCKDWDVLVLGAASVPAAYGFTASNSSEYPEDEFTSWRRGDLNLIVVRDATFYDLCLAIAEACKASHRAGAVDMRSKENRIRVHNILQGKA